MRALTPDAVNEALFGESEIALVDVREHGQYGEGHPFLAVNLPYSRLEIDAPALLPSKAAPIVLLDDGDGVCDVAARRLAALQYENVAVMDGGAHGWARAGFTLFKGVNVPSKAFGELLEHARHTPALDAEELKAWQDEGRAFMLLDGRTPQEYRRMTLPGSVCCPNAELAHRLSAIAPDPATPVVVHCAGRTRSILGVESLRAAGVENPVYALRNGTQGWQLAGLALEHGSARAYPEIGEAERTASRETGRALRARHNVPAIDLATLAAWRGDAGRTLYLLDARTAEEYAAGHLRGARHAPGGQLVQATDQWIAVRGARIVLSDDTGLRAALAAHWLRRMGHDAVVLDADVTTLDGLQAEPEAEALAPEALPRAPLGDLPAMFSAEAQLLDLNPSMAYRRAHIEGARWGIRPRLKHLGLETGRAIVLIAEDRRIAELAALDLRDLGHDDVRYADADVEAWRAAGLSVTATPDEPADGDCIDYLFFVHDRHTGNLDAARAYLDWEVHLVQQMSARERAVFRLAS